MLKLLVVGDEVQGNPLASNTPDRPVPLRVCATTSMPSRRISTRFRKCSAMAGRIPAAANYPDVLLANLTHVVGQNAALSEGLESLSSHSVAAHVWHPRVVAASGVWYHRRTVAESKGHLRSSEGTDDHTSKILCTGGLPIASVPDLDNPLELRIRSVSREGRLLLDAWRYVPEAE